MGTVIGVGVVGKMDVVVGVGVVEGVGVSLSFRG